MWLGKKHWYYMYILICSLSLVLILDRPDAPYNLSVISYTWESVYMGWTPGFNGGESQSFFIHFTSSVPPIYTGEITVSPPDATRFNITGKLDFVF